MVDESEKLGISRERTTLCQAAILARKGNHAAAIELLRESCGWLFAETTSDIDEALGDRRNCESDVLQTPLVDLIPYGLDLRFVNMLEDTLGCVLVIDLNRWPLDEIKAVPSFGEKALQRLKIALNALGVEISAKKGVYKVGKPKPKNETK